MSVDGTSARAVLNITQLGVVVLPITVETTPVDLTDPLPSAGGTFKLALTLEAGTTGWSAAVSKGELIGEEGFVEIDKTAPGTGATENEITVTYTEECDYGRPIG